MAAKMATMFGDRPPAAPSPIKYTSSCREDQRLFTEGKIISKYCNMSKTLREFHHRTASPPPPALVPRWGYDSACTSEV